MKKESQTKVITMPEITEIGDIQRRIDKKIQVQKAKRTIKGIAVGTFKTARTGVRASKKAWDIFKRSSPGYRGPKDIPQHGPVGSRFYKTMLPEEKYVHDTRLKIDSINLKQELDKAKTFEREVKKQKARERGERLSSILGIRRSTPKPTVRERRSFFQPLPKETSPLRRLFGSVR